MLFGQGHREQTQCLSQDRAKSLGQSLEERQQNAEKAHRARGAPRGALPEKTGICRRFTELRKSLYNRVVSVRLLPCGERDPFLDRGWRLEVSAKSAENRVQEW